MKEAGYENGFKTSILVFGGELILKLLKYFRLFKRNWHWFKNRCSRSKCLLGRNRKGRHDLFLGSWGVVTGDADYGLYAMYHSSAKGGAGNRDFYENPKVDELLDKAKMTTNPEEEKNFMKKFNY